MKTAILATILALAAIPSQAQAPASKEIIHGVVVHSRHGDRQSKVYKGYQVTNLGAQQLYNSGSFYRSRYIDDNATHKIVNISSDAVKPSQLSITGPDQAVLLQTATNFIQGLYPPLSLINSTLASQELSNGTKEVAPLNGYQFIQIHADDEESPEYFWLKGSDSCPGWTNASATYKESNEYLATLQSSAPFYAQFNDILASNLPPNKISFANAYDVFDLINVAQIHNNSEIVTAAQLDQLRYYANDWEHNMNYNRTMTGRSIGGASLAGSFLKGLNETISNKGAGVKFTLTTGSYNTFLAFFGLSNLDSLPTTNNFTGLPNYAASIAFELFSISADDSPFPAEADLNVRFLFRNGTDAGTPIQAYPLFGGDKLSLPYPEFKSKMEAFAITGPKQWCAACGQTQGFCSQPEFSPLSKSPEGGVTTQGPEPKSGGMSNAVAGVIGAAVTLGVVAIVGGLLFFVLRRRKTRSHAAATAGSLPVAEKKSSKDASSSIDGSV